MFTCKYDVRARKIVWRYPTALQAFPCHRICPHFLQERQQSFKMVMSSPVQIAMGMSIRNNEAVSPRGSFMYVYTISLWILKWKTYTKYKNNAKQWLQSRRRHNLSRKCRWRMHPFCLKCHRHWSVIQSEVSARVCWSYEDTFQTKRKKGENVNMFLFCRSLGHCLAPLLILALFVVTGRKFRRV